MSLRDPISKDQSDPRNLGFERGFRPRSLEPAPSEDDQRRSRFFTIAAVGVGLLVGLGVSAVPYLARAAWGSDGPTPVVIRESAVQLTSLPSNAAVYIDGARMGLTPLSLSLPVGVHIAELRSGVMSRRATLTVEAGKILTQHVDFGSAPKTGRLQVTSDPSGAAVSINGLIRGETPLDISELVPGEYRVTISRGATSVDRTIQVTPGATATVVASVPVVAANGWVAIEAPVELEVFEAGRYLASGRVSRISLPPGRHVLSLVNTALAYRTEETVNIVPGRYVALKVPMPSGALSINALPWADVLIDGRSVGQTPIGNLALPLGPHEVTWRHPDYGERRQMVIVSTEPARLGIDWTR